MTALQEHQADDGDIEGMLIPVYVPVSVSKENSHYKLIHIKIELQN